MCFTIAILCFCILLHGFWFGFPRFSIADCSIIEFGFGPDSWQFCLRNLQLIICSINTLAKQTKI